MNKKHFLLGVGAVLSAWVMTAGSAFAQTTDSGTGATGTPASTQNTTQNRQLADYIVAIVQREPVTYSQLRAHMLSIKQQSGGQELPPDAELQQAALQQLIMQSALVQRAHELGLRVEPQMVDQALLTVAANNGMALAQFKAKLEEMGIPYATLRREVERQILISQLRERTLDPTINVSNAEIDEYIAQRSNGAGAGQSLINLAQILIAVPENATAAQEQKLQARAQEVYALAQGAKSPAEFVALVEKYSDDPQKATTQGVLGARPLTAYPDLFVNAVQGLRAGGVTPPVRSGAGFHIIVVLEREQSDTVVMQTNARHILLTISAKQTEQQAIEQLLGDKRKIETGQISFEELAREQSQDGSAKNGGDLGWMVPGMFVPEFERVMEQLKPGQISDPVVTRFGVHLIQVVERREAQLTPQQQRDVARETIHQRKVEQAYEQWAADIQSQAYIEMREPPR